MRKGGRPKGVPLFSCCRSRFSSSWWSFSTSCVEGTCDERDVSCTSSELFEWCDIMVVQSLERIGRGRCEVYRRKQTIRFGDLAHRSTFTTRGTASRCTAGCLKRRKFGRQARVLLWSCSTEHPCNSISSVCRPKAHGVRHHGSMKLEDLG